MKTVVSVVVLLCVAAACAERQVGGQRRYIGRPAVAANQPYWFLGGPRTRSNGFQTIQMPVSAADFAEDDEDDDDQEEAIALMNDDEDDENSFEDNDEENSANDDDDDYQELDFNNGNIIGIVPLVGGNSMGKNYWRTVLSKNGGNTGSIMVPDGMIELEGQGIVDEETGETALFVPREALAGIPDGSVVALIDDTEGLGKANKVIVRRVRRKGNGGGKRRKGNRRRRGGNKRRPNGVRVIRPKPNRGGGNRRRRVVPSVIRI